MKREIITKMAKSFEEHAHIEEGTEYWMARDLQTLLDYDKWENFVNVIEKAKTSCLKSGHLPKEHFPDVRKMVPIGSGATREVSDIMLTRYACYLIAQNGDPKKAPIAFAQSYFALQTRKQEMLENHIKAVERLQARNKLTKTEKELSSVLYEHGINNQGFARIRSKGDEALFGGKTTKEMKNRLGVPESRALADFLPTITIKAKDFAGEITHFNVKKDGLYRENQITEEHVKNNNDVRQILAKNNIYPEELPVEEDIKKLEKQLQKEDKKLIEKPRALPNLKT